jgi:methyl-accepting chemotaxis protein
MEAISASSRQIVDIIGVIDGIAFQTNILALNAAVEAARRRARPRLCRGGAGSAHAGAALGQRGQGDQAADRRVGGKSPTAAAGRRSRQDHGRMARSASVSEIMAQISRQHGEPASRINRPSSRWIVTQQNAALVEEGGGQPVPCSKAAHLAQLVSVFKVDAATHTASVTPIGQPRAHRASGGGTPAIASAATHRHRRRRKMMRWRR